MIFKLKSFCLIVSVSLTFGQWNAQSQSQRQKQLEQRRAELQNEIRQITALLFAGKKEQKSVVSVVEDLNYKISIRKNLIRITNQQANFLTREINANQGEISARRDKLKILKEDYATMIVKTYKSRTKDNKLMFLLSAANFQQAYRRLQYIKQYADYQKEQAALIKEETKQLQLLNKILLVQKKEKQSLVDENKAAKAILDKERKAQQALIASIKKELLKFSEQIKTKPGHHLYLCFA